MASLFGLNEPLNLIFYMLVSIGFVVGIILMVAPKAFTSLHKALQKEYGITKRILPQLENASIEVVDKTVKKNTVVYGMVISIVSFILLLIFK